MTKENFSYVTSEPLQVFVRNNTYEGGLPFFYAEEEFPELSGLKKNWEAIRDEILESEKKQGQLSGHKTYNTPPISGQLSWSNYYLDNFMWRSHKNRKIFPFLSSLVDQIPNCTLASVSILSPHSSVKPHYGDTNGITRCHLGLIIPADYPVCGIRVGGEERGWKEGELTIFTEAHLHDVWNNSDQRRYIVIVDIIPSFMKISKLKLCSQVLGAQSYIFLEGKFPLLKKMPEWTVAALTAMFSIMWYLYLPIQRKLGVL